jgi:hypothetical protein
LSTTIVIYRAWQEIANIINAGNSVKIYVKEIQKKWDNICANAKTEVSLHLNLSNNSKSSYISNGLFLSLISRIIASKISIFVVGSLVFQIKNVHVPVHTRIVSYAKREIHAM